jgi:D-sedoheptulose 7-phosphate isomerase
MQEQRIEQQFLENADLHYKAAQMLSRPIAAAIEAIRLSLTNGGKVLVCGNGGSAACAQHFASEFVGCFERERPSLGAVALSTDAAVLTALAKDYGFSEIFAKQVRALGGPNDVLMVISSSGSSANVLAAIDAARERDMVVLALTGGDGGAVALALRETDVHIGVPHERSARIQETHLLVLHCICDGVDELLLGAG